MTNLSLESILAIEGPRRLHIGGKQVHAAWKILNALPGDGVDYLGDMRDLSAFENESFDAVYASHVIEHLSYNQVLVDALKAVHRILRPGGKFFVSVPDMDILCRLFVHEKLSAQERFQVMRMMFGGQLDAYDFHYVGLNAEFLRSFLAQAGFTQAYRVASFGIFEDTSATAFGGVAISLNMVAMR
jgi:predicted SAM-dependent methyltransferase